MKREILYRGKRTDGKGWAEGGIVLRANGQIFIAPIVDASQIIIYAVDPDTVGQYTGLKDRNGKRVFEGDVVDVVCSGDETWRCVVSDIRNIPAEMCGSHVKSMEVIGNIHNNPEMLNSEETARKGG